MDRQRSPGRRQASSLFILVSEEPAHSSHPPERSRIPTSSHFSRCCSWLRNVRRPPIHDAFNPSTLAKVLPPPSPPHFFLPFLPSPSTQRLTGQHSSNPVKQQAWSPCIPLSPMSQGAWPLGLCHVSLIHLLHLYLVFSSCLPFLFHCWVTSVCSSAVLSTPQSSGKCWASGYGLTDMEGECSEIFSFLS